MGKFQEKAGCFHVSQHYAKQQLRCKDFHGNQAGTLVQLCGGVGVIIFLLNFFYFHLDWQKEENQF